MVVLCCCSGVVVLFLWWCWCGGVFCGGVFVVVGVVFFPKASPMLGFSFRG